MERIRVFNEILEKERIRTVYQPIVKLKNGNIYGYEALSRATLEKCPCNIEELFQIAGETMQLWEFERLCRSTALKNACQKPLGAKLFLNVDANILHDPKLKSGFTCKELKKYGLKPEDIIFEVTEKSAIKEMEIFREAVRHYKNQTFQIAIDDFGSGYSGMNRICEVAPEFIKLDMHLVRDIDQDEIRKSAVKATVQFCEEANIKVIGEGIETKEELETLIQLGVGYGQGYYMAKPNEEFIELEYEQKLTIKGLNNSMKYNLKPTVFDRIETICHPSNIATCDDKAVDIYNMMHEIKDIKEVYVVDSSKRVCGILTRAYLCERFSGQYGYNLNRNKKVSDLMLSEYLEVESNMRIDEVSKAAMSRNSETEYDAVVVTDKHQYIGTVTVKELLNTAIDIQIKRATEANPLTGLPGNNMVQNEMQEAIRHKRQFAVAYLDLDNFKAYNDAYGFSNGDCMIKLLAACIKKNIHKKDFAGHIGGDDFVIVSYEKDLEQVCKNIIFLFRESISKLYNQEDLKNGYILSKNRSGFIEKFPLATISIAIVDCSRQAEIDILELSEMIAQTKKHAKQIMGDSISSS